MVIVVYPDSIRVIQLNGDVPLVKIAAQEFAISYFLRL